MTFVSFRDISSRSKLGIYAAEARSPDNKTINQRDGSPPDPTTRGYKWGGHQSGFRYQLLDGSSGRVVWERWQKPDEKAPEELYVADNGWTVIRTHGDSHALLIAVSPEGQDVLRVAVGSRDPWELPEGSVFVKDEHARDTTAGLHWTRGALSYFFELVDRTYFCLATNWGRRILLDLDSGKLADEPVIGSAVANAIYDAEYQVAVPALVTAAAEMEDYDAFDLFEGLNGRTPYWEQWPDTEGQIALVIRNGLTDALPSLQALERRILITGYTGCWAIVGNRETFRYSDIFRYNLRPLLSLAIRYFGERPAGYACHGFFFQQFTDKSPLRSVLPLPECIPRRDELVQSIALGMSRLQVLELVGAPDFHGSFSEQRDSTRVDGEYWDYYHGQAIKLAAVRLTWFRESSEPALRRIESIPLKRAEVYQRIYDVLWP